MTPQSNALFVDRLSKVYADGTLALDAHELRIPAGSFFGLLGPNGAGKTTLIASVAGLVRAPAGRISSSDTTPSPIRARDCLSASHRRRFDEPTAGVDLELRHELWRYLRRLARQATTVVLTTHYIEEAEELCGRVAFIRTGRIVAEGDPRELIERFGGERLENAYLEVMR